jgi:hypothetical protein
MSFAIQLDQDQAVINNKLIGEFTPALVLEFFQDLSLKLRQSGFQRIFTDATERHLSLPLEEYDFLARELAGMRMPENLKLAILVEGDLVDNQKKVDLILAKGFEQVKLFQNEVEARKWLMD